MSAHVYGVRPRKDKRGFDLISDALPFGVRADEKLTTRMELESAIRER